VNSKTYYYSAEIKKARGLDGAYTEFIFDANADLEYGFNFLIKSRMVQASCLHISSAHSFLM